MSIINRFPSGGGAPVSVAPKDVNFYDYDGTLLFAYTVAQANALSALPTATAHTGLTFQEWNYTLAHVNATTRSIDVGATYVTDDGKTRLYIHIDNTGRATVPLYWSQTVTNGVTIDWGDESALETASGTGNKNASHTYAAIGDYTISLYPASGCTLELGNGYNTTVVIGGSNIGYSNILYKAEFGIRVNLSNAWAFYKCYSLSSVSLSSSITSMISTFSNCGSLRFISIPRSVTSIGNYDYCYSLVGTALPDTLTGIGGTCFSCCYSLRNLIIPDGVTTIANYAFEYCMSIQNIVLPNSLTSLGPGAFTRCFSARSISIGSSLTTIDSSTFSYTTFSKITVPSNVTTINNSAFNSCTFAKEYHFLSTTPPTLGGSSVFTGIPSDCIIYVPMASVDAYKAASYWSTHASKIVGE